MRTSRVSMAALALLLTSAHMATMAEQAEQAGMQRADPMRSTGQLVRAISIGPAASTEPSVAVPTLPSSGADSEARRQSREAGLLQHWARLLPPPVPAAPDAR